MSKPSILDCRIKKCNAHRTIPMTTAKIDTVLIEDKSRPVTILELQEKDTGESESVASDYLTEVDVSK